MSRLRAPRLVAAPPRCALTTAAGRGWRPRAVTGCPERTWGTGRRCRATPRRSRRIGPPIRLGRLLVGVGLLGDVHQLVHRCLPSHSPLFLVGQHVPQEHSAMTARSAERDQAIVEHLDQRGTGDAQDVGRLLGRQLLVGGRPRNDATVRVSSAPGTKAAGQVDVDGAARRRAPARPMPGMEIPLSAGRALAGLDHSLGLLASPDAPRRLS
jgi:hypothetical protein